jgi:catechol 2,3-dioxygenase-like lactoylglutathione lyase family enzyme
VDVIGFDWMLSCTTAFDQTVAFYRDILGLDVTEPRPARVDSNFARYACAVLPDGGTLEIVEPRPGENALRGRQILCLRVPAIHPALRDLEARGAHLVSGPFDNGEGLAWVYVRAPDGNVYQIYGDVQGREPDLGTPVH